MSNKCPLILFQFITLPPRMDMAGWFNTMFWNLNCWDQVSAIAGEVPFPTQTLPNGLWIGVIAVVSGYMFPLMAGIGLSSKTEMANATSGWFVTVARETGTHHFGSGCGNALAIAITVAATFSCAGQHLAEMKSASLLVSGFSSCGWLPSFLERGRNSCWRRFFGGVETSDSENEEAKRPEAAAVPVPVLPPPTPAPPPHHHVGINNDHLSPSAPSRQPPQNLISPARRGAPAPQPEQSPGGVSNASSAHIVGNQGAPPIWSTALSVSIVTFLSVNSDFQSIIALQNIPNALGTILECLAFIKLRRMAMRSSAPQQNVNVITNPLLDPHNQHQQEAHDRPVSEDFPASLPERTMTEYFGWDRYFRVPLNFNFLCFWIIVGPVACTCVLLGLMIYQKNYFEFVAFGIATVIGLAIHSLNGYMRRRYPKNYVRNPPGDPVAVRVF